MKRINKISILMLILFFTSTFFYAKDVKEGSVKKPGRNKVVLVGRVSYKTPLDFSDYAKSFDSAYDRKNVKSKPHVYCINDTKETWEIEEPFYYTTKVMINGKASIEYSSTSIFGNPIAYFELPMKVRVKVPKDAKFVYIGNFQYELDYALRVVGFNHYDEFDKAQEQINRATGKEVELVRGELEFLK